MRMDPKPKRPFGEESCEAEIDTLQRSYSDYYFTHTFFTEKALDEEIYLFVGRKGAGKTSLAHYFTFRKSDRDYECIDVDEPMVYHDVLCKMAATLATGPNVAISRIARLWEYIVWMLIFAQFQGHHPTIKVASVVTDKEGKWSRLIRTLLRGLFKKYAGDDGELISTLENIVDEPAFQAARTEVLKLTQRRPGFVVLDSLEDYATDDEAMMDALAGLVECASKMNKKYAGRGVHLKVFITAEVFPHLCEEHVSNLLKFVREPLHLLWRPKELIRLICWRLYSYLQSKGALLPDSKGAIDWESSQDVIAKMWVPYFGATVTNAAGVEEQTLPYIVRHTQLRPRQMIVLCNAIAGIAQSEKTFPRFSRRAIVTGIQSQETSLAKEVLNSFKKVHPHVADIVSALTSLPVRFHGRRLDFVAKDTASQWTDGKYSLMSFRRLVAELGIVGRVRRFDERSRQCSAVFESCF